MTDGNGRKDTLLVVATKNKKKLIELKATLEGLGLTVHSIDEVCPDVPAPEETGDTFDANARLKALYFAEKTGALCLADDSGLEVDCLGGEPGVRSARYAGEPSDDRKNNEKLVAALAGVPEDRRGARFRCAVAVAAPNHVIVTADGACPGRMLEHPRGEGGFGYDPYFYHPPLGRAFAELTLAEKERISHRGQALRELVRKLPAALDEWNKERGRRS